MQRT
jgi:curved DNA-binding protein CbpA